MNSEIKAKWLEALRSGKYKQTDSKLHDTRTDGYCCLGVLCDVIDPNGWRGPTHKSHSSYDFFSFQGAGDDTSLPLTVRMIADLGEETHEIICQLIGKNDTGEPFPVIADYIEKEL